MIANLVQYNIGDALIQSIIWGDTPVRDVPLFEEIILDMEDYIPAPYERIQVACPIINNLEIKETWDTTH